MQRAVSRIFRASSSCSCARCARAMSAGSLAAFPFCRWPSITVLNCSARASRARASRIMPSAKSSVEPIASRMYCPLIPRTSERGMGRSSSLDVEAGDAPLDHAFAILQRLGVDHANLVAGDGLLEELDRVLRQRVGAELAVLGHELEDVLPEPLRVAGDLLVFESLDAAGERADGLSRRGILR